MTLACTIDSSGISAPTYAEILSSLQTTMQSIYGSDIYIDPDSQDGQLLAAIASAINDANNATITTFLGFSPDYAQGVQLSTLVKINGIARLIASYSSAPGNVVGQAGTIILGGIVADENGNQWLLPASVTIPGGGSIVVTVTAINAGAINAASGTINQIVNPIAGWQSFTSTSNASPGNPVETDPALRARQTTSTGLPALTVNAGLLGNLLNLPGITAAKVYENDTSSADGNGAPAHSIYVVIAGGNVTSIAQTMGQDKTPGASTYGTTSAAYTDPVSGIIYTIYFYVLATQDIKVVITGNALSGYSSLVAAEIQAAVSKYISNLGIGVNVQFSRMYLPAYLNGAPDSATYEITDLTIQGSGAAGQVDIVIPFNKSAICATTDVTVTIS